MRPTLTQVAKNIEKYMSIDFEGHDKEENLSAISDYLIRHSLHVEEEDDFLDSLLQGLKFRTIEDLCFAHIVEFWSEEEDRNEGLALKDVA